MKRFSEQFQKQANKICLSGMEKRDLRERLVAYMEYHPQSVALEERNANGFSSSIAVRLVQVNLWQLTRRVGAVLGIFVFTLTLLAERAVPGDALYAVKVNFNEELRGTLVLSPSEKVVWETERLSRRIAEARLLSSEGKLTEAVEADLAEAIRVHSENARRGIETLRETDKDEAALASIQFETVVDTQMAALKIAGVNHQPANENSLIEGVLNDSLDVSKQAEGDNELPAYDRLVAKVEQETTRSVQLLATISKIATKTEQMDIRRRLDDIDRSIASAMANAEADESAARGELVAVLQRIQRLIVFMTDIDVRRSVTVEDIVPIALTVEERNQIVSARVTDIRRLAEVAETASQATTTDAMLLEKLLPAIAEVQTTASSSLSAIPADEVTLVTLEQQTMDALTLIRDVLVALGVDPDTALTVEPEKTETIESVVPEEVGTTTSSTTVEQSNEAATSSPEQVREDEVTPIPVEAN